VGDAEVEKGRIIDATDARLGRLASYVAKLIMKGERVTIINAEKAIITGDPDVVAEKYLERRRRGSPHHGPFFPKRPDLIVYRAIRGMVPRKKSKGREALRRLTVYMGEPKNIKSDEVIKFREMQNPVECRFIRIEELSKRLGWVDKRV